MSTIALSTLLFTTLIVLLAATVLLLRLWLMPQRSVTITIDGEAPLPAVSGVKLLGILLDAGYTVPSVCAGAGTCGLCKVTVTGGGGDLLSTEKARLSATECEKGIRLACQLMVENDLAIALPGNTKTAAGMTCTVKSTRNLSTLIKEITLRLPDNSDFEFTPGEFVQVTAPEFRCSLSDIQIDSGCQSEWDSLNVGHLTASASSPVTRAYSIASTPADKNTIVLLIRLALPPPENQYSYPPGQVSSWLFSLRRGDKVAVTGPFGDFSLQDNDRDIVLIGGGVGMAPLRAMAHQQLSDNTHRNLHFYYGARGVQDLLYKDEFDRLADSHANFDWTIALSDVPGDGQWTGPTGFIHQVVQHEHIDKHANIHNCDYYLCGPPLMLQATVAMLTRAGVKPNQIFADDFGS